MKSSALRLGTKRPCSSVTVAVTLISSTPVRNENPWPVGFSCARAAGATATAPSAATTASFRSMTLAFTAPRRDRVDRRLRRRFAVWRRDRIAGRACRGLTPPIDVLHNGAVIAAETDAIARDGAGIRHSHAERRFAAGKRDAVLERRTAAGEVAPVVVEQIHHDDDAVLRLAVERILHETGDGEAAVVGRGVTQRQQFER